MRNTLIGILLLFLPFWSYGAARSVNVTFINSTRYTMVIIGNPELWHGMWRHPVPTMIYPGKQVSWESESNGFMTGTEGRVRFKLYGIGCTELVTGVVSVHWNNPWCCENDLNIDAPNGFNISRVGTKKGKNPRVTCTLTESGIPTFDTPLHLPHDPVQSLKVKIKTSNKSLAGTDDDVYFSIGPQWWKLDEGFKRKSTREFTLGIEGMDLRASDIMEYSLEKKGKGRYGLSDTPFGEWHPEWIELYYNNQLVKRAEINSWLASPNGPFWTEWIQQCKCIPYYEYISNSLRLVENKPVPGGRELSAWVTGLFKEGHISGWIDKGNCNPEDDNGSVSVNGVCYRKPVISADGFATVDIEVTRVKACGMTLDVTDFEHFNRKRYLRIEYRLAVVPEWVIFISSGMLDELRDRLIRERILPDVGQCVNATGVIKWDTDDGGWHEVHTTSDIMCDK